MLCRITQEGGAGNEYISWELAVTGQIVPPIDLSVALCQCFGGEPWEKILMALDVQTMCSVLAIGDSRKNFVDLIRSEWARFVPEVWVFAEV